MNFYTIGVYNSTQDEFFRKLVDNKIDMFCDIRQRRGVRGSKYSFVNSTRLQEKLNDLNIRYQHIFKLAPTNEIRQLQKDIDKQNKETKSERTQLGEVFIKEYTNRVIDDFDFESFFDELKQIRVKNIVLFCVEEDFKACHRSIVSAKLRNKYNYQITHL